MKLRYRISFILLLLITGYIIFSYLVLRGLVFSSYLAFEKSEAQKDTQRCVESLRREIFHISTVANDWAAWNDMYEFVHQPDERFIRTNLIPETFIDNHLDLICIYNKDKTAIWGQIWDRMVEEQIDLPEFYPVPRQNVFYFFKITDPEESVSGIFMSSSGPILLACHPVTTSKHKGPIRGFFLMGAFLKGEVMESLRESTQVDHEIIPLAMENDQEVDDIIKMINPNHPVVYNVTDQNRLEAFSLFYDITGKPALLFKTINSRNIFRKGSETLNLAFLLICFSAVIITIVLLFFLGRAVISPISNLTRHVTCIGSMGESLPPPVSYKKDEIGLLYSEFAGMLRRVKEAHMQMKSINKKLSAEISERKKIEQDLLNHRDALRKLSAELQKTEERERRRIANDLHDGIGQKLALMQVKLDMLSQYNDPEKQAYMIGELSEFMGSIIHDTRTLTFNISPPVLYDIGLEAAVEWFTDDLSDKYGLPISVQHIGNSIFLETGIRIALYRAVRELLYNAVKHSGADEVSVIFSNDEGGLSVSVTDNGKGFDMTERDMLKEKGLGLFSIRENIRALGGSVEIDSNPERGSRIVLHFHPKIVSQGGNENDS